MRWLAAAAGLVLVALVALEPGPMTLEAIEALIRARFPSVEQVPTEELARRLDAGEEIVLLDVRRPEEYAVSHLPGAVRVDPDAEDLDGLNVPADAAVVTYCSVGYRSSALAERLMERGRANVANLEGSIFAWAGEGRTVVRNGKPVREVHPYGGEWAFLVEEELRAYAPPHVFYLHGRIIEDQGERPTHPQFGVYEYRLILDALRDEGFEVISERRSPGTDMTAYAERVAGEARELLSKGVPPERITVVGFSKGGGIAIRASALLGNPKIGFVWLASCGDGTLGASAPAPTGEVLSVFEASDPLGVSCGALFERGRELRRDEVRIETGLGHGAFYTPRPEWMGPVVAWIHERAGRPE
jgi:hypothetical protein